jgi:hypothetical protein
MYKLELFRSYLCSFQPNKRVRLDMSEQEVEIDTIGITEHHVRQHLGQGPDIGPYSECGRGSQRALPTNIFLSYTL